MYTIGPCNERAAKRLAKELTGKGCTVSMTQEGGFWYLQVNPNNTGIRVGR